MRTTAKLFVACAAFAVVAFPASADTEYTAGRKLGRALAAIVCSPLELPGAIVDEVETNGPPYLVIGVGTGVGKIFVRVVVGVYELLTAPFAVPAGYEPVLEPEYPWGYFD